MLMEKFKPAIGFIIYFFLAIACSSKEQELEAKMILANDLVTSGQFEKALQVADEILAIDSTLLNAKLFKGVLLTKMEKYKEGVMLLEEVIKTDADNLHANFYLGLAYLSLEQYKTSCDFFTKALNTKKSGDFLFDMKSPDPSSQATEIRFVEILYWRGVASYYNDFTSQSIRDFNTCISHGYNTANSYLYQGYNYLKLNDMKNACTCFNNAVAEGNADALPFKRKYCE